MTPQTTNKMSTIQFPDDLPLDTAIRQVYARQWRQDHAAQAPVTTEMVQESIRKHRDHLKASGVKAGGYWFHSDADSRIQQLALFVMGSNVPPVQWKTLDGSFVTMTQTIAGQIFQATAQSDMAIFAVAESHLAGVNAAADPASYDWSTGWPAGFVAANL